MRIEEVNIGGTGTGKSLDNVVCREKYDLVVLALKPEGRQNYVFNQKPYTTLAAKDILVVMGRVDVVHKLRQEIGSA